MTRSDRLLILALAALTLLTWPLAASAGAPAERVTISGPAGVSSVPLKQDATLVVQGQRGTVKVVVKDEAVRVESADCPDHVCVKTGSISATGGVIACVPNGVVISIEGGESSGIDARIH